MPHIVILPLSLYVDTKLQRSIDAFAKMGVSKASMLWNWFKLNTIFNHYRKGNFDTARFKKRIGQMYPQATKNEKEFDSAWNAQCQVTEITQAAFEEVRAFEKEEVEVYFFASTNPLHIEHIKNQAKQGIPGNHFWSYEHHQLGIGLIKKLLGEIKDENPKVKAKQISFFYQQPGPKPYEKWGILGWLIAPFARWEHLQKVNYVTALQKLAKSEKSFTMTACEPSQPGNIRALVNRALNGSSVKTEEGAKTLFTAYTRASQEISLGSSETPGSDTAPGSKGRSSRRPHMFAKERNY